MKHLEYACCNAAVSPDGQSVAYSDTTGIRVRSLASGDDRLVIANSSQLCDQSAQCFGNFYPGWSTDGRYLSFVRVYYEGNDVMVADTETPQAKPSVVLHDALSENKWSPTGDMLCTGSYFTGPLVAYDAASGRSTQVPSGATVDVPSACAWSPDGHLAASYANGDLALFDGSLRLMATVAVPRSPGPATTAAVQAWTPDSQDVLVRLDQQNQWLLLDLAGGLHEVDLDADRVFAVLP